MFQFLNTTSKLYQYWSKIKIFETETDKAYCSIEITKLIFIYGWDGENVCLFVLVPWGHIQGGGGENFVRL